MQQHEKYPTICDYTLTISHDMSVIHDVKHYETPMQKLQTLILSYGVFVPETVQVSGTFSVLHVPSCVKAPRNRCGFGALLYIRIGAGRRCGCYVPAPDGFPVKYT